MWVVYELETGWSSEDMRFANRDEASEFMRAMSDRCIGTGVRWEE